jgi:hypothetical protein
MRFLSLPDPNAHELVAEDIESPGDEDEEERGG